MLQVNRIVKIPAGKQLPLLPGVERPPAPAVPSRPASGASIAASLAAPVESAKHDGTEYEEMSLLADESVLFKELPRRCFVRRTGYASCQGAHLTNKIRNPNRQSYMKALLTYLGKTTQIVASDFDLDHPSNMIWLSSDLHVLLDLYSVFCIVPSDDDLRTLIELVEGLNKDWQKRVNKNSRASRDLLLSIGTDVLKNLRYRVLIFYDDYFGPHGLPFPLLIDGVAALAKVEDHQLVNSTSSEPLAPFLDPIASDRDLSMLLNPFLLLINSIMKVREYAAENSPNPRELDGHAKTTKDLLEKLETLMYFVARPEEGSTAWFTLEDERRKGAVKKEMEGKRRESEKHTTSRRSGLRQRNVSMEGSAGDGGEKGEEVEDEGATVELTDTALQRHDEMLEMESDRAECDEAFRLLEDPTTSAEERGRLMDWAASGMDEGPPLTPGMQTFLEGRRAQVY